MWLSSLNKFNPPCISKYPNWLAISSLKLFVFHLVNYLADTSDALCPRARTHRLVRECVCVSMQQIVGLLDLNVEAPCPWLMSLTFFPVGKAKQRSRRVSSVCNSLVSRGHKCVSSGLCQCLFCELSSYLLYKRSRSPPTYSSWTRKSMLYGTSCDHPNLCCCYFSLPLLIFSNSSCCKKLMSIGVLLQMTDFGSVWKLSWHNSWNGQVD